MPINHQLICPVDDKPFMGCPCKEYSREGRCDWPYRSDMTPEQIREKTKENMSQTKVSI